MLESTGHIEEVSIAQCPDCVSAIPVFHGADGHWCSVVPRRGEEGIYIRYKSEQVRASVEETCEWFGALGGCTEHEGRHPFLDQCPEQYLLSEHHSSNPNNPTLVV